MDWFCDTNSSHRHSTEWEAKNCSEMFQLLCELEDAAFDDELDYDDVRKGIVRLQRR